MPVTAMPPPRSRDTGAAASFPEYSYVVLAHDVRAASGDYPSGTRGVIVHKHADGIGYEVEFETPAFGVLTLTESDLSAA